MNIPLSKNKLFLQMIPAKPSIKISEFPTFLNRMSTLLGEEWSFDNANLLHQWGYNGWYIEV